MAYRFMPITKVSSLPRRVFKNSVLYFSKFFVHIPQLSKFIP